MTDIPITLKLTDETAYAILTTAAEGGINYWASFNVDRNGDDDVVRIHHIRDGEDTSSYYPDCGPTEVAAGIAEVFRQAAAAEGDGSGFASICGAIAHDLAFNEGCLDAGDCDDVVQFGICSSLVYG